MNVSDYSQRKNAAEKQKNHKIDFKHNPAIYQRLNKVIRRDYIEKKMLKMKLQKNEEVFHSFFEEVLEATVLCSESGKLIRVNHSTLQLLECSLRDILGKNIFDFIQEQYRERLELTLKTTNSKIIQDKVFFQLPNGKIKYLAYNWKKHPLYGYHMIQFHQIRSQYEVKQRLYEGEECFRNIFMTTNDGMVIWNHQYEILEMNTKALSLFQCSSTSIKGHDIRTLFHHHPELTAKYVAHLEESNNGKKEEPIILTIKTPSYKKYLEIYSKRNIAAHSHLTVIRDISEKMEMLEQIRKSDTLNIVGELAAGIAHEIRNPMTALKGFIQLLESSVNDEHTMYFNVITTELQRIESIITEFLILAKPQDIQFRKHDVRKIMSDTLELLHAQAIMHNVQFDTCYDGALPQLFCEPNQLKQVFINIAKNAIEVMPKGGIIRIKITVNQDGWLHIAIQDEGEGIPKDKLKKLGEPFYTTKERGTGLGLMVSFKIIEEHQGRVELESEFGVGTTFHIYLPIPKE
ncbi:PAS domain-containing sensor histidine kinase [Bacillus chungangensis]|nr:ATP-binding protein [Bacillus chungangensis]